MLGRGMAGESGFVGLGYGSLWFGMAGMVVCGRLGCGKSSSGAVGQARLVALCSVLVM